MDQTFLLERPRKWRGGLILASPHSGRDYPDSFLSRTRLDIMTLRSSEDAFVDRLIRTAAEASGAVVLAARVPRSVVDLNRGRDDLDPLVVEGARLPKPGNPRTQAGLGVIPRVVAQGRVIFHRRMSAAEAEALLDAAWQPYHDALAALMDEAVARFGRALLIDMHSMPREALSHLVPRPQVVLGDRYGRSAGGWLRQQLRAGLEEQGLSVRLNAPFAGAYVAVAYGDPGRERHVVQLEVDRSLYMDEARLAPHEGFDRLAGQLARAIAPLTAAPGAMAAE
ncbi:N-formylglutamate amidohydrolase [Paracoccus suum]|uniref:N-formylglutamate amidohydrolase n=1 Tax=Paracoccus suum TaxID=2259340 RepID=A0A344PHW0_9RHOB|nr:N-formylglutamate amidohydrolase [Paracoccus suum]AXC48965.1 N-formylglutamate amidohydrolase [Paracoccus suum]